MAETTYRAATPLDYRPTPMNPQAASAETTFRVATPSDYAPSPAGPDSRVTGQSFGGGQVLTSTTTTPTSEPAKAGVTTTPAASMSNVIASNIAEGRPLAIPKGLAGEGYTNAQVVSANATETDIMYSKGLNLPSREVSAVVLGQNFGSAAGIVVPEGEGLGGKSVNVTFAPPSKELFLAEQSKYYEQQAAGFKGESFYSQQNIGGRWFQVTRTTGLISKEDYLKSMEAAYNAKYQQDEAMPSKNILITEVSQERFAELSAGAAPEQKTSIAFQPSGTESVTYRIPQEAIAKAGIVRDYLSADYAKKAELRALGTITSPIDVGFEVLKPVFGISTTEAAIGGKIANIGYQVSQGSAIESVIRETPQNPIVQSSVYTFVGGAAFGAVGGAAAKVLPAGVVAIGTKAFQVGALGFVGYSLAEPIMKQGIEGAPESTIRGALILSSIPAALVGYKLGTVLGERAGTALLKTALFQPKVSIGPAGERVTSQRVNLLETQESIVTQTGAGQYETRSQLTSPMGTQRAVKVFEQQAPKQYWAEEAARVGEPAAQQAAATAERAFPNYETVTTGRGIIFEERGLFFKTATVRPDVSIAFGKEVPVTAPEGVKPPSFFMSREFGMQGANTYYEAQTVGVSYPTSFKVSEPSFKPIEVYRVSNEAFAHADTGTGVLKNALGWTEFGEGGQTRVYIRQGIELPAGGEVLQGPSKGFTFKDVLQHELTHVANPQASEAEVIALTPKTQVPSFAPAGEKAIQIRGMWDVGQQIALTPEVKGLVGGQDFMVTPFKTLSAVKFWGAGAPEGVVNTRGIGFLKVPTSATATIKGQAFFGGGPTQIMVEATAPAAAVAVTETRGISFAGAPVLAESVGAEKIVFGVPIFSATRGAIQEEVVAPRETRDISATMPKIVVGQGIRGEQVIGLTTETRTEGQPTNVFKPISGQREDTGALTARLTDTITTGNIGTLEARLTATPEDLTTRLGFGNISGLVPVLPFGGFGGGGQKGQDLGAPFAKLGGMGKGWGFGKRSKKLVSDWISVTVSQIRFGRATHPKGTKREWAEAEGNLFGFVPTEELRRAGGGKGFQLGFEGGAKDIFGGGFDSRGLFYEEPRRGRGKKGKGKRAKKGPLEW